MAINHKRTRQEMEDIIRLGGSVRVPGRGIVSRVEHLPTEAELAAGDPEQQKKVESDLQAQLDDTKKQLKAVQDQIAADKKKADDAAVAAAAQTNTNGGAQGAQGGEQK